MRRNLDSRLRGNDAMWRSISLMSLIEFLKLTPMRESGNPGQVRFSGFPPARE
jgi:hypothetical protein